MTSPICISAAVVGEEMRTSSFLIVSLLSVCRPLRRPCSAMIRVAIAELISPGNREVMLLPLCANDG